MSLPVRPLALPLLLGLSLVAPAAAQLSASSHVLRACDQSQGNASLSVGGLPQLGGQLALALSGEPLAPFLLVLDSESQGFTFGNVSVCVGPEPIVLANGFANPFFVIPPTGEFRMDLAIPDDPALAGQTFHVQALIGDSAAPNGVLAVSNLAQFTIKAPAEVQTVFFEDFEAGWGSWWVTNGTWEIGVPTSGPGQAFSGVQCAATGLASNYPAGTSTRLVSPAIALPQLGQGQELRLSYRVWFSLSDCDSTEVQVSTDGGQTWVVPSCSTAQTGVGGGWTQASVNLSEFAGEVIQLGVRLSTGCYYSSSGTYLDDLHLFTGQPFFASPQGWEQGLGEWWSASKGVWQAGAPTAGPSAPHSGTSCAGTLLGADYPGAAGSRLEGPPLSVPASAAPELWFWHWFSLSDCDSGSVQVSLDDGCTWTTLASYTGSSNGTWTPTKVSLAAYAGQTVRLAFRLDAGCYYSSSGWFVDDLVIQ